MLDRLTDHFRERLAQTAIVETPFPHLYCEEAWPQDVYDAMLAGLPTDAAYERMAPPYEERLALSLTAQSAAPLDAPWPTIEAWVNSQVMLDLMAEKFAAHLVQNARHRLPQIQKHAVSPDEVGIAGRVLLARDYANYAIGPHTDSPGKFIVGIFYLSKDRSMEAFGTSIYRHREETKIWKSPHMERSAFDLVRTFPNRPNSLFVFMKTDNSFHGVEADDYSNTGRDVLFWLPEIGGARTGRNLRLPKRAFVPDSED